MSVHEILVIAGLVIIIILLFWVEHETKQKT